MRAWGRRLRPGAPRPRRRQRGRRRHLTTVRLLHTAPVGGVRFLGTVQRRPQRVLPVLPGGRVHQQLTVPGEPDRTEYAGVLGGAVTEHSPPACGAPVARRSARACGSGVPDPQAARCMSCDFSSARAVLEKIGPQEGLLGTALQVTAGLGAAGTAAMLLKPFRVETVAPEHAGGLAAGSTARSGRAGSSTGGSGRRIISRRTETSGPRGCRGCARRCVPPGARRWGACTRCWMVTGAGG